MGVSAVQLVVGTLATWRLTAFLYYDHGLFGLMHGVREKATGLLAKQFECFWCLSLWAGLAITPLMIWLWWVLIPLALSGATLLLSHSGRIIWREIAEA